MEMCLAPHASPTQDSCWSVVDADTLTTADCVCPGTPVSCVVTPGSSTDTARSPASLACIERRPLGTSLVPRPAWDTTPAYCVPARRRIYSGKLCGYDRKLFAVIWRRRSLTRHCYSDGVCPNASQRSKASVHYIAVDDMQSSL